MAELQGAAPSFEDTGAVHCRESHRIGDAHAVRRPRQGKVEMQGPFAVAQGQGRRDAPRDRFPGESVADGGEHAREGRYVEYVERPRQAGEDDSVVDGIAVLRGDRFEAV